MTITPDTIKQGLTLAARSATGPLIVNRYDDHDGAINWQLQQERPDAGSEDGAEVICNILDYDWKHARQTAEFFAWCTAHGAGMCTEVERLRTRVSELEDERDELRNQITSMENTAWEKSE